MTKEELSIIRKEYRVDFTIHSQALQRFESRILEFGRDKMNLLLEQLSELEAYINLKCMAPQLRTSKDNIKR